MHTGTPPSGRQYRRCPAIRQAAPPACIWAPCYPAGSAIGTPLSREQYHDTGTLLSRRQYHMLSSIARSAASKGNQVPTSPQLLPASPGVIPQPFWQPFLSSPILMPIPSGSPGPRPTSMVASLTINTHPFWQPSPSSTLAALLSSHSHCGIPHHQPSSLLAALLSSLPLIPHPFWQP